MALASSPRGPRRPDARPDEILDAALDAFLERGFEAARMEDVARRAGLSKAGVYLYFQSKDALLQALIERAVKPVATQAEALAERFQHAPAEALRLIVEGFAARMENSRVAAIPWLVLSIAPRFPAMVQFYREEVVDRTRGAVKRLVRAGIAQGVFRPVPEEEAARLILGPLLMGGVLRHVLADETVAVDAQTHLDLVLRGIGP